MLVFCCSQTNNNSVAFYTKNDRMYIAHTLDMHVCHTCCNMQQQYSIVQFYTSSHLVLIHTQTGGILGVDGCVYAPPYSATGVLQIDPENNDKVEVLENFPPDNYLWHGGLLAKSTGVIYAFPAHSNKVLCIDTNVQQGKSSERSGDGDGDVGGVEEDESW